MNITTIFYLSFYFLFCLGAVFIAAKWWETRQNDKTNEFNHLGLIALGLVAFASWSLLGDISSSKMQTPTVYTPQYEKAVDNTEFNIPGVGKVKYMRLFSEVSNAGESMDSFALRVAPMLRQYSDENGYEACGVIATNGETYSIVVGTNFGYMVCVNSSRFVLNGYQHAGATLHSHGRQGRFRPSKTDLMLMEATFAGQRANLAMVHGQALNTFSSEDIKSGPGYLAGEDGKLFYQGNGTSREIK